MLVEEKKLRLEYEEELDRCHKNLMEKTE